MGLKWEFDIRDAVIFALLGFTAAITYQHFGFTKEVITVYLFAMVFMRLVRTTTTHYMPLWVGSTLWLVALLGSVTLVVRYVVPIVNDGIHAMVVSAPQGMEVLRELGVRLQDMISPYLSIEKQDEFVVMMAETIKGKGGDAAGLAAKLGIGFSLGVFNTLLGLLLLVLVVYSWEHTIGGLSHRLVVYRPNLGPSIVDFFRRFEAASANLFRGVGLVMLFFTPVYIIVLLLFGLGLGKSMVWGIVLGFFTGIPSGSFVAYPLIVILGFWNFFVLKVTGTMGIDALVVAGTAAGKTVLWLLLSAQIIHLVETKLVTPYVMKSVMGLDGPLVLLLLFGSVLLMGASGVVFGLFGLAALKAADEIVMERHAPQSMAAATAE